MSFFVSIGRNNALYSRHGLIQRHFTVVWLPWYCTFYMARKGVGHICGCCSWYVVRHYHMRHDCHYGNTRGVMKMNEHRVNILLMMTVHTHIYIGPPTQAVNITTITRCVVQVTPGSHRWWLAVRWTKGGQLGWGSCWVWAGLDCGLTAVACGIIFEKMRILLWGGKKPLSYFIHLCRHSILLIVGDLR